MNDLCHAIEKEAYIGWEEEVNVVAQVLSEVQTKSNYILIVSISIKQSDHHLNQ